MSPIDPYATLAALVLDEPGRAELFEELGFDYCCRGDHSLAAACAQRDLDIDTFVRVLDAYTASRASMPGHDYDCRSASTAELCDHIVEAHHLRLRHELPRLAETLTTVVRVHGGDDSQLNALVRVFDGLACDLLAHLDREEKMLFPACRTLDTCDGPLDRQALLDELGHDHTDVGETLLVLRDLAGGYHPDGARCDTHRALLKGLHALERDLHQHIHEENNILFPRIRSRLAT
jgi:regulator of cell morphogenesis and NO signaling